MKCYRHREREAVNTCSRCGEWLCQECSFEVDGRLFCRDCIGKMLAEPRRPKPSRRDDVSARVSGYSCHRHIGWFPLFICTFILPGISYMYLGLIKRGLLTMSTFFLIVYFLIISENPLLAFAIPVLWITTAFDAFHTRTKINAGIPVADDVSDVTDFISRNKRDIILALMVLFGLSVMFTMVSYLGYYFHRGFFGPVGLIVIAVGVYFISRGKAKKRREDGIDDIIDKRNDM